MNKVFLFWKIDTPILRRALATDPKSEAETIARVPMGRLGTTTEIAEAVVWLCSDAASFVTGHLMAVDDGEIA